MARAAAPGAWSASEILDGISDAVYVLDRELRFAYVNEQAPRLLRRRREELVGQVVWDVFPDLGETAIGAALQQAHGTERVVSLVERYAPLDGWFSLRVAPLRGGLLVSFHDVTELKRAEAELEQLSDERAALHRIADLIARQRPNEELFQLVAREAARLQRVEGAAVMRWVGAGRCEVMGNWTILPTLVPGVRNGAILPKDDLLGGALPIDAPAVARDGDPGFGPLPRRAGRRAMLHAPVAVDGAPWGALVLTSDRPDAFGPGALERHARFADLLAVAITNAESRARLMRMASTDPLTGLANHRVFHAHLREAIAATEPDQPLAVAVLGLDRFRDVNDMHGHLAGDAILAAVGDRLARVAEDGQLVARIGGDQFGLLLPGHTALRAHAAAQRAKQAIAERPFGPQETRLTASVGIADLARAGHGDLLFACADGALFWAKLHGRDMICSFHPALMDELSPADRAEAVVRGKTLAGIMALARAIDAKDPTTRQHSERVAWLAELLARECGWHERRIRALHEAALVHDIGKIGIPDEILLHDGRLTGEQYALVKTHAGLGAEIVEGVLTAEQVAWVRSHHERPDGTGYPEGLTAERIPDGAAVLSVADVLDVMTVSRPYSRPLPLCDAVDEIERLVGAQFLPEPAAALRRLYDAGALGEWDAGPP